MLRLFDKSPGPSWTAWTTPISFNIYSTTNPDMTTVYYYPKDETDDPSNEDNFTTFKKQLVSSNVLKNGVKSMDYIDDEDDVIHIDSEQEFMEAIKFAKAYKEKNGQSVFLLIEEKSPQELDYENAKVSTGDDKAELIEDEVKIGAENLCTVTRDDSKAKNKSLKKKSKSSKTDDKSEPNDCCKNYLEQFKQEIIAEVTKNVLKKLSNALNPSEIESESSEKKDFKSTSAERPAFYREEIGNNQTYTQNNKIIDDYTLHETHYCGYPQYWIPKPTDFIYHANGMVQLKESLHSHQINQNVSDMHSKYVPAPVPSLRPSKYRQDDDDLSSRLLLAEALEKDLKPRPSNPNTTANIHRPCVSRPVEKESHDDQKKKPRIINSVVLKRDDLTPEHNRLVDQLNKRKYKRPNVLEMKSTIKKIATPSPKKSSSSKIKNKTKVEKDLLKKISTLKLEGDEVQKSSGCKRKSLSSHDGRTVENAMRFKIYEKMLKNLDEGQKLRSSFFKNMDAASFPWMIPMKNEESNAKDDGEQTWTQDANESDREDKEKDGKVEEVLDQDEQSTSDDVSTLSETSSLSGVSENNFELVYYDKETNSVDVKNKRESSSDAKENSAAGNTPGDLVKNDVVSVKNESSTAEDPKNSEKAKKEVRFDVIIEDIGPDNEAEEFIPELIKRPGGDYSYVRETLPKTEQAAAEASEITEKNNKEDCNLEDKESQQNSPSHSATAAPMYCFASQPPAPKLPMAEEKSKRAEKKIKDFEKKIREVEKKLKVQDKSRSKTRDDRAAGSSVGYSVPFTGIHSHHGICTNGSGCYGAVHNPELLCDYRSYPLRAPLPHRHNLPSHGHGSGPIPAMFPPPPSYPSCFYSPARYETYAHMDANMQNLIHVPPGSVGSVDHMKSFHENIATEAAAQAYPRPRQSTNNYLSKQKEKR